MVNRELERRQRARAEIPGLVELQEDEDHPDDYYQCLVDKSYCYLSQLTTEQTATAPVACIDHHSSLEEGNARIMKIRFSDEELKAMLARVKQRASNNKAVERTTAPEASESTKKRKLSASSEASSEKRARPSDPAATRFSQSPPSAAGPPTHQTAKNPLSKEVARPPEPAADDSTIVKEESSAPAFMLIPQDTSMNIDHPPAGHAEDPLVVAAKPSREVQQLPADLTPEVQPPISYGKSAATSQLPTVQLST